MPHAVWPRSAAARALVHVAAHCRPLPPQETLKHLKAGLVSLCGASVSWCTQGLFEPSKGLWRAWGLILNAILPLLPSCWGFSFAFGCEVSFFVCVGTNILLSMVVQQRVAILEFSQEKMHTSFYSAILLFSQQTVEIFLKIWKCQIILPAFWETCMQVKKQQLEPDMKQPTGSKLGKEYPKAMYYHPAYLTYMQSTSWKCQTRWSSWWNHDCWKKHQ